jgi:hypothetical protein
MEAEHAADTGQELTSPLNHGSLAPEYEKEAAPDLRLFMLHPNSKQIYAPQAIINTKTAGYCEYQRRQMHTAPDTRALFVESCARNIDITARGDEDIPRSVRGYHFIKLRVRPKSLVVCLSYHRPSMLNY